MSWHGTREINANVPFSVFGVAWRCIGLLLRWLRLSQARPSTARKITTSGTRGRLLVTAVCRTLHQQAAMESRHQLHSLKSPHMHRLGGSFYSSGRWNALPGDSSTQGDLPIKHTPRAESADTGACNGGASGPLLLINPLVVLHDSRLCTRYDTMRHRHTQADSKLNQMAADHTQFPCPPGVLSCDETQPTSQVSHPRQPLVDPERRNRHSNGWPIGNRQAPHSNPSAPVTPPARSCKTGGPRAR